jgi:hypothetical protein
MCWFESCQRSFIFLQVVFSQTRSQAVHKTLFYKTKQLHIRQTRLCGLSQLLHVSACLYHQPRGVHVKFKTCYNVTLYP